jgi:hypothetical protein
VAWLDLNVKSPPAQVFHRKESNGWSQFNFARDAGASGQSRALNANLLSAIDHWTIVYLSEEAVRISPKLKT